MQNWEARILAREHELNDKEGDLVRQAATATELRAGLEAAKELISRRYKTPEGADDLQAIEGIGPKIANLLRNADIKTFERLSETSLGELTRILEAGGPRFGLADPMSWAEQASCLVNRDFVAFEELKESLIAGVRRDEIARQPAVAVAAQPAATAGGAVAADSASEGAAAAEVAVPEAAAPGAARGGGDEKGNAGDDAGDAAPAGGPDAGGDAGTRPGAHDDGTVAEGGGKLPGDGAHVTPGQAQRRAQGDGTGPEQASVSNGPLFEAAAFSGGSGSGDPDGSRSR